MQKTQPRSAFTLVELLAVLAIIALIAAFAIPALTSSSPGKTAHRTAIILRGQLDLARSNALAMNSPVRIGMAETTDETGPKLVVSMVQYKGDNPEDSASWVAIEKADAFSGMRFDTNAPAPADGVARLSAGALPGWSRFVGPVEIAFDHILEIRPDGGVNTGSAAGARRIEIAMVAANDPERKHPVAVEISPMTGMSKVREGDVAAIESGSP